jgi:hypothetical protein
MSITRVTSIVCVVVYAGVGGAMLSAQRGAGAKKLPPGAVAKAEQAIEKAAAEKKITLSPGATQALAAEVIHQESAKPAPDVDAAISHAKLDQLLAPIEAAKSTTPISQDAAKTLVVQDKNKQVVSTLNDDIARHVQRSGKTVDDAVRVHMLEDLTKQSDALAKSGLPIEVIRAHNDATLKAIDLAVGDKPYTVQTYQLAYNDLFKTEIPVDFSSTPDGASVSINGSSIGSTNITAKMLYPGTYTVSFALAGFETATRPYSLAAGLDADSVTESLTPTSAGDFKTGTSDTVEKTTTSSMSTTVLLLTTGLIVLIGLGVFVARRRR